MSRFIRCLKGSGPEPLILQGNKSDSPHKQALSRVRHKPRDFCIKVDDQTIHVHKSILCAWSDYFCVMMESGMKESDIGEIRIQDTRADVVKTMIGYFYGDDTCIEWKQIKDYVDIVELWQLTQVKPELEAYIAKDVVLQNCIDWFIFADTYHMEHVVLRITELINAHFTQISSSKEFKSLSLSVLISFLSHKNITHNITILEGCIRWVQTDEPSRKHDFSVLLSHIRFNECNPAYLKRMLNTYNDSLITDQAIQAQIQEAITSSFILIGGYDEYTRKDRKVYYVNLTSHTMSEIGKYPDELTWYECARCVTDSGIFYGGGRRGHADVTSECVLLDLVDLTITSLPSLPAPTYGGRAAAVGSKVFMIGGDGKEKVFKFTRYLDLQDKQWIECKPGEQIHIASLVAVDSFIYQCGVFLSCYDTENNTWSYRALPPVKGPLHNARAMLVDKDIYYVGTPCLRYSTINDKWTTLAKPPTKRYCHAMCLQGSLVLCSAYERTSELRLHVYDITTNTWRTSPVKLPKGLWIDFVCTV